MTMSPAAIRTARRNLVLAIDRFITGLIKADRLPTADQLANLHDALIALEQSAYSVGEDAIFLAEKGWKPRHLDVTTTHSFAELVERFERLRTEE